MVRQWRLASMRSTPWTRWTPAVWFSSRAGRGRRLWLRGGALRTPKRLVAACARRKSRAAHMSVVSVGRRNPTLPTLSCKCPKHDSNRGPPRLSTSRSCKANWTCCFATRGLSRISRPIAQTCSTDAFVVPRHSCRRMSTRTVHNATVMVKVAAASSPIRNERRNAADGRLPRRSKVANAHFRRLVSRGNRRKRHHCSAIMRSRIHFAVQLRPSVGC